jgi:hypothetical protein
MTIFRVAVKCLFEHQSGRPQHVIELKAGERAILQLFDWIGGCGVWLDEGSRMEGGSDCRSGYILVFWGVKEEEV